MIQVTNLTKRFDNFTALENISCTIHDGCIYGLVGSNGAGKSTLLRVITGVYKNDSGSVTIDGQPVWENPEVKGRFTFVPDELYFLPGATINRMASLYKSIYKNFDTARCKECSRSTRKSRFPPFQRA